MTAQGFTYLEKNVHLAFKINVEILKIILTPTHPLLQNFIFPSNFCTFSYHTLNLAFIKVTDIVTLVVCLKLNDYESHFYRECINIVLCPIIVNCSSIEHTMHTSCRIH